MSSVSLWNSGQRRAGSTDSFIPRVSHVNSLLMSCLVKSNMKSVAWNFFTLFLACSSVILSWIVLKRKVPSWLRVSTIYLDCPSPAWKTALRMEASLTVLYDILYKNGVYFLWHRINMQRNSFFIKVLLSLIRVTIPKYRERKIK